MRKSLLQASGVGLQRIPAGVCLQSCHATCEAMHIVDLSCLHCQTQPVKVESAELLLTVQPLRKIQCNFERVKSPTMIAQGWTLWKIHGRLLWRRIEKLLKLDFTLENPVLRLAKKELCSPERRPPQQHAYNCSNVSALGAKQAGWL